MRPSDSRQTGSRPLVPTGTEWREANEAPVRPPAGGRRSAPPSDWPEERRERMTGPRRAVRTTGSGRTVQVGGEEQSGWPMRGRPTGSRPVAPQGTGGRRVVRVDSEAPAEARSQRPDLSDLERQRPPSHDLSRRDGEPDDAPRNKSFERDVHFGQRTCPQCGFKDAGLICIACGAVLDD